MVQMRCALRRGRQAKGIGTQQPGDDRMGPRATPDWPSRPAHEQRSCRRLAGRQHARALWRRGIYGGTLMAMIGEPWNERALARMVLDDHLSVHQIADQTKRSIVHVGGMIITGCYQLSRDGDRRAKMIRDASRVQGVGPIIAVNMYLYSIGEPAVRDGRKRPAPRAPGA